MKQMGCVKRGLEELTGNHETIWMQLDDDVKALFVEECKRLGYAFKQARVLSTETCGKFMALHSPDKTMYYISGMCWVGSFKTPEAVINVLTGKMDDSLRINYKKFISGEEEFIYHR